MESLVANR